MAKKKTDEKTKKDFDIDKKFEMLNPFMIDGFKRFLMDKNVKSEEEFKKYLEEYGGC